MEATVQRQDTRVPSYRALSTPGNSRAELYKKILKCLDVHKVYLDRDLNLVKFSSIVGTAIARICTAA